MSFRNFVICRQLWYVLLKHDSSIFSLLYNYLESSYIPAFNFLYSFFKQILPEFIFSTLDFIPNSNRTTPQIEVSDMKSQLLMEL